MSQAEELLMSLSESVSEHAHIVVDSETHFVIDPVTREIDSSPHQDKAIMQYDHASERFTFELPRYVEGHDMTLCNRVRVHYINIDGETGESNSQPVELYDLRVDPENPTAVICSWVVTRNATQLAGTLNFLVQYMCVSDMSVVDYEFHSNIYRDLPVKKNDRTDETAVIEYSDIIEQWRAKLFGAGDSAVADITLNAETQLKNIETEGAEQVAAVVETKDNAIAEIIAKGETTLASIPEDYTATHNMAKAATRTKASAIVVTAEGETVVAEDCSDDYLRGLHVYGKTTQVATTGAQLANLPDYEVTLGGIVWTCAGGVVKAVGTCNAESSSTGNTIFHDLTGLSGTFYVSGSRSPAKVYVRVRENGTEKWYSDRAFTLTGMEESVLFYIQVADVGTVVDTTVYPMLNIGDEALPWEPYSGGVASPSPEWSQDLNSIADPVINIYGQNLFDDRQLIETEVLSIHGNMPVQLQAGEYVVTVSITGNVAEQDATLVFYNASKERVLEVNTLKDSTFVLTEEVQSVNIYPFSGAVGGTWESIAITAGLNISECEPYKPIQTLPLNRTLHGIPVESGGNYTDSNGQQWICDEIDFERGVYVKRVHAITDWSNVTLHQHTYTNDSYFVVYVGSNVSTVGTSNDVLCTHLVKCGGGNLGNRAGVYSYTGSKNTLHISVPVSVATDVASLQEWLVNNDFAVAYAIAPIETPLTEEELLAFSKLHSNSLVTTALNSENAYMGLVYNADTKAYLERYVKEILNTLVKE